MLLVIDIRSGEKQNVAARTCARVERYSHVALELRFSLSRLNVFFFFRENLFVLLEWRAGKRKCSQQRGHGRVVS